MIVQNNIRMPDFLLVGAQKSGTSSMASYLRQHYDISISRIKEPNFFSYYNEDYNVINKLKNFNLSAKNSFDIIINIDDYLKLFDNQKKIYGDCSTHYLYHYTKTIETIKTIYKEQYQSLKIIIILRNPVYRAFSAWSMFVRDGKENEPFLKALTLSKKRIDVGKVIEFDYLGFSLYANQIDSYLEAFNEVEIIIFEDFFKEIYKNISKIYTFLGVDNKYKPNINIIENFSGRPKNRFLYNLLSQPHLIKYPFKKILPAQIRKNIKQQFLEKSLDKILLTSGEYDIAIEYFKDDITQTENTLGKKIKSWKKK
ncbi:MAG: hypothetical protein D3916_14120 [Candidatus Electrothrix sp. MAN1_4]|nr:hypothetical protein [Candidatus Electrothrix sp. MAN1_4]